MEPTNATNIDEGLYSRQLYVLGHEAMQRMAGSSVLIMGLGGLGVEIAKNIILAGVKSVTLYDPSLVTFYDLSSQFYLSESDVGKPRDLCSAPKLALLNQYVPVTVHEGELHSQHLANFQVVVVTETSLAKQLEINDFTHANNIKFISADIRGLFGMAFCDFGKEFVVSDVDGETPQSGMLAAVSKELDGVVTVLEDSRHRLEDGDYVKFSEVQGMTQLNETGPFKVTVVGPHTFKIGDTSGFSDYTKGGVFTRVKMPKTLHFKSLRESLETPEFLVSDFAKFDRPQQLHLGFQALDAFVTRHSALPLSYNEAHAQEVVAIAKELASKTPEQIEINEKIIAALAHQSRGSLAPMAAVIGGMVAQEALKAVSGKFHPIFQYLYFDSLESLPKHFPIAEQNTQPLNTRYDGQVAVFGTDFQHRLADSRQFLVGAGAIGCEMLKNWALIGLGAGAKGVIHVTDMDTIEKSNLNRQFLFRPKDVGQLKSATAAAAAAEMNPEMRGQIVVHSDRVGADTEHVYGDDFFAQLDFITNALDNVEARTYMDRRCVYYHKPLLESGTMGTKGNTQVVVPRLTESYSSSQDPPEKTIPMCTLKNFPNAIEHTIQWARDLFEGLFASQPEYGRMYLTNDDYIDKAIARPTTARDVLNGVIASLGETRPKDFQDCVSWARLKFQELYHDTIAQLLFNFPPDSITSSGAPFWSGPKRAPSILEFDVNDPAHLAFVQSAALLRASNYGITPPADDSAIIQCLSQVHVPEFTPKSGVKIQVEENDTAVDGDSGLDSLLAALPSKAELAGVEITPSQFEKDDDSNHHMDFITAASNLRARNYRIAEADRHQTKGIAGKIIPAIATTTSLVTGLVCLELYKIVDGERPVEDYKNGFVNLALPFLGFSEPILAAKQKYLDVTFTQWDRFEIEQLMTLGELLDYFAREHRIDVTMISSGNTMLYSAFSGPKKAAERKPLQMLELVELVSKKPVAPHVKYLVLEFVGDELDGGDIEDLPYIKIRVRK
ncbi:E1 ubiquitin-activating protein [Entomophthora muscae]|uniref:E1 ubiquitin-activating protein n=1 Tax=Entomophthora muscae TaxID=34485 RepID=A0ACC2S488_9FUNG|nr:E1 ubiquitin-activating protein [Entomophthora muscae]